MVFGSKGRLRNLPEMPVYVDDVEIELVTVFMYIGIFLDSNLTFEHHNSQVYKKSSKKSGALCRTREHVDQSTHDCWFYSSTKAAVNTEWWE